MILANILFIQQTQMQCKIQLHGNEIFTVKQNSRDIKFVKGSNIWHIQHTALKELFYRNHYFQVDRQINSLQSYDYAGLRVQKLKPLPQTPNLPINSPPDQKKKGGRAKKRMRKQNTTFSSRVTCQRTANYPFSMVELSKFQQHLFC